MPSSEKRWKANNSPGNHHLKKMEKTSFHFSTVLPVIAAGYLQPVALWSAEDAGISQEDGVIG
jgi:hypothetical protein